MNNLELALIKLVKEDANSIALESLVERYRPMIDNMYFQYKIGLYDQNDWYQEALIVCYATCKIFDGASGSKFGSFFKLKFKNHIIDIVRRENTVKRQANQLACSYEQVIIDESPNEFIKNYVHLLDTSSYLEQAVEDLSKLELIALQFLLGELKIHIACELAMCDTRQLHRAANRCRLKIMEHM
ncbi:sigma-70 family RNA polymerase sigma factor [Companilactobacillus jidongensis]|uniref:sigma-70 family RNA polymerase sigma factor n=1 Tax=Companilactobacillus jidongensis TaxID=2486006 RepID=UPI0013DD9E09|nr:sigma-70 family RNA polymerase sigma factor [Companilactobacillus jidongensis]